MKVYVASVSGGKDSTALCLHLRDLGIPFRAVHFNTGWEHADTYRYLAEVLPDAIGQPIEFRAREPVLDERRETMAVELETRLGFRSPMVRWILSRGMFPSRMRRFCTQELKVFAARDVMREVHAAGDTPINVVGIRAAESQARAKLEEYELAPTVDCLVWRPLIAWSERQVIDLHHKHGVRPNPLYLRGANRVGCWPCINGGKAELRMLDEARIAIVERLEAMIGLLSTERHEARGEVLTRPPAFFQGNRRDSVDMGPCPTCLGAGGACEDCEGSGRHLQIPCIPIRKMVAWARTTRGGKELDRQASLPGLNDGCMRWGMCDLGGQDGDP